jgi:copper chaperone NosL
MIAPARDFLLIAFMVIALAACSRGNASIPSPAEVTSDSVAEFCGMSLNEHAGPKAQIFLQGEANPHWFASVHNAFAYTMLREQPHEIAAFYVNDMGKAKNWDRPEAGTWIEAHKAVFVIESRRRGGMDESEAVPFSDRVAAAAFSREYGGRLIGFTNMPKSYILPEIYLGSAEGNSGGN